ncbi:hypothetical protein GCM10027289_10250 [Tsukamurella serpentis]
MSRPSAPTDPARGRVIVGSVVVGVLIVIAAAAGATAFVSRDRDAAPVAATPPASSQSAEPQPSVPSGAQAPPPDVPGADRLGFLDSQARCAEGDTPRMIVLTAVSQAVVCERAGALYYAGWRMDTASGTRVEGVLPAGPGWVARAPDATVNITPAGLVISTGSGDFTEPATASWVG